MELDNPGALQNRASAPLHWWFGNHAIILSGQLLVELYQAHPGTELDNPEGPQSRVSAPLHWWFGNLAIMLSGELLIELYQAHPFWPEIPGQDKDLLETLHLTVVLETSMESVAGDKEVWTDLFSLLPP